MGVSSTYSVKNGTNHLKNQWINAYLGDTAVTFVFVDGIDGTEIAVPAGVTLIRSGDYSCMVEITEQIAPATLYLRAKSDDNAAVYYEKTITVEEPV